MAANLDRIFKIAVDLNGEAIDDPGIVIREGDALTTAISVQVFKDGKPVDLRDATCTMLVTLFNGVDIAMEVDTASAITGILYVEFPVNMSAVVGEASISFAFTTNETGGVAKLTTGSFPYTVESALQGSEVITPEDISDLFDLAIQHEQDRVDAEVLRVTAEGGLTPKTGRKGAEADRVISENARVTAEGGTSPTRTGRKGAEADRIDAEAIRVTNEGDIHGGRVKAEADRVIAEAARALAEGDETGGRVKAELDRVAAEGDETSGRVKAELDRVAAEAARELVIGDVGELETEAVTIVPAINEVLGALDDKVDKVTGKGLSDANFTAAEKAKLALQTGTNTGDQDISGKFDKSNIDTDSAMTANSDTKVPSQKAVKSALALKVDKSTGYGLSKNDYSDAEKAKVAIALKNNGNMLDPIGGVYTYSRLLGLADGVYYVSNAQLVLLKLDATLPSTWTGYLEKTTFDIKVEFALRVCHNAGGYSRFFSSSVTGTPTGELPASFFAEQRVRDYVTGGTISTALSIKVDKITGKGLSTNDYTATDKSRVDNALISRGVLPTPTGVIKYTYEELFALPVGLYSSTNPTVLAVNIDGFADGKMFRFVKILNHDGTFYLYIETAFDRNVNANFTLTSEATGLITYDAWNGSCAVSAMSAYAGSALDIAIAGKVDKILGKGLYPTAANPVQVVPTLPTDPTEGVLYMTENFVAAEFAKGDILFAPYFSPYGFSSVVVENIQGDSTSYLSFMFPTKTIRTVIVDYGNGEYPGAYQSSVDVVWDSELGQEVERDTTTLIIDNNAYDSLVGSFTAKILVDNSAHNMAVGLNGADGMVLSGFPNLGYFEMQVNNYKRTPNFASIPTLHHIDISQNDLQDIPDLSGLMALENVFADKNYFTQEQVEQLIDLLPTASFGGANLFILIQKLLVDDSSVLLTLSEGAMATATAKNWNISTTFGY